MVCAWIKSLALNTGYIHIITLAAILIKIHVNDSSQGSPVLEFGRTRSAQETTTGVITLMKGLDFEQQNMYKLQIFALVSYKPLDAGTIGPVLQNEPNGLLTPTNRCKCTKKSLDFAGYVHGQAGRLAEYCRLRLTLDHPRRPRYPAHLHPCRANYKTKK